MQRSGRLAGCWVWSLLAAAACAGPLEGDPGLPIARTSSGLQTITYVGKQSITDFTGLGQHLQYWPLFGLSSGQTARRTDDPNCIELTPDFANFRHHYLPPGRTFSNDALGIPIGTKTRGGYPNWATFTLPSGVVGRSGTFYDESNVDNSNNTVNELVLESNTLSEFCLNLITDNTAGEHNPDVRLEARSDTVDLGLAGHPDLSFDGTTDMYTFRYAGMADGDVIKIRFQCSSASGCQGAGLGGFMVSDISTCTASAADAGTNFPDVGVVDADGQDAGTIDAGAIDAQAFDAGAGDGGSLDAISIDAEAIDTGALDAGPIDAPAFDANAVDADTAGEQEMGGCGCRAHGRGPTGTRLSLLVLLLLTSARVSKRMTIAP